MLAHNNVQLFTSETACPLSAVPCVYLATGAMWRCTCYQIFLQHVLYGREPSRAGQDAAMMHGHSTLVWSGLQDASGKHGAFTAGGAMHMTFHACARQNMVFGVNVGSCVL